MFNVESKIYRVVVDQHSFRRSLARLSAYLAAILITRATR
jgi:hypothetical protein